MDHHAVLLEAITDLADQAVVLPVVLMTAVWIATTGWVRGAIAWAAVIGGTLGLVGAFKVVVISCRAVTGEFGLQSPSGHTVAASLVAGGIAVLVRAHSPNRDALAVLAGASAALVIGLTRVLLGAHTIVDVAVASPIGMGSAWMLSRFMGAAPQHYKFIGGLIVIVLTGSLFYHVHAGFEPILARFAMSVTCVWSKSLQ